MDGGSHDAAAVTFRPQAILHKPAGTSVANFILQPPQSAVWTPATCHDSKTNRDVKSRDVNPRVG
eukprot:1447270-Amphidinium_carterae.1